MTRQDPRLEPAYLPDRRGWPNHLRTRSPHGKVRVVRLMKVEFKGFKRLRETSCNFDGRLIALIGPNEAGKSSVLSALDWHCNGERALLPHERSRDLQVPDEENVVRVTYLLDDDDKAKLTELPREEHPSRFVAVRTAGGEMRTSVFPRPCRDPRIRRDAYASVAAMLGGELALNLDPNLRQALDAIQGPLGDELRRDLIDDEVRQVGASAAGLEELFQGLEEENDEETLQEFQQIKSAIANLKAVEAQYQTTHPFDVARRAMWLRSPDFVLFGAHDRDLRSEYDLADEGLRNDPPQALANVLTLAGTDVESIWAVLSSGTVTDIKTLRRRCNAELERTFKPNWKQSDLTIELDFNNTVLQILIHEDHASGVTTTFSERSDGLRMFVALIAFLTVRPTDQAPILLIDEAEMHLHLDAQADLVGMLQVQEKISQVIYTTHSPGCLPPDLGTGIRLVSPDPGDRQVSHLSSDFWSDNKPGFSSLLFAMGAGAAAFSAFRYAVMAEGVTEMLLLPTMLRAAIGADVPYQVAPGLSVMIGNEAELETTAARLCYLVDGDMGGSTIRAQLLELGVKENLVHQLPDGAAIEDLLDVEAYLTAVNAILRDADAVSPVITTSDLTSGLVVGLAVSTWAKNQGLKAPSKRAVANYLIQDQERVKLSPTGVVALAELHSKIMASFNL